MNAVSLTALRQRADYTHKHNAKTGRHGWLRLTPAYSVKIVEELIAQCDRPMRIFDPFCGTATTALSAAYHGHDAVTTDINPFLIWLGRAKTANYSPAVIASTLRASRLALSLVRRGAITPIAEPPIHNINRWWSNGSLKFLQSIRAAIEEVTDPGTPERTLLLVAFCRSLISCSNASFNHQSMSFKDVEQISLELDDDISESFASDVDFVLRGAAINPVGSAEIVLGDSRNSATVVDGSFDMIITSPPYVNRMSYIRELRPYMYWLGFLSSGRDAGELDWAAIGGTWGIATSRLIDWKRSSHDFSHGVLQAALSKVSHLDNKNGQLLANYIEKYFEDMWLHFSQLTAILARGAKIHYIVGNSTFYGVLLPVEEIYMAMLRELGFTEVKCRAIRKRNSKKELIEFDVMATWPR